MEGKIRKTSKRIISLFLTLTLVVSVFVGIGTTADATSYNYNPDAAISYARSHCSGDANKNSSASYCQNGWLCAEFVYNCLVAGGYKKATNNNIRVPYTLGQEILSNGGEKISCKTVANQKVYMSYFSKKLTKGDVIIILYTNNPTGSSGQGHAVIYSGDTTSDGVVKVYAHNNRKQNENLVTSSSTKIIYAIHIPTGNNSTYSFNYDSNGGSGSMSSFNVSAGDTFTLSRNAFTKSGHSFEGWHVRRNNDNTWYVIGKGWCTEATISSNGYSKKLYSDGCTLGFDDGWTNGLSGDGSYTFVAVWKADDELISHILSGVYIIHSAYDDNMVLDIAGNSKEDNANIQLHQKDDTDVQKFRIIRYGDYYCIKSIWSDKWLDLKTPIQNKSNVKLFHDNSSEEEYWQFIDAGDGYYYIKNRTGYYLDLEGDKAVNNANIQVYNFVGTNSQKWRLEDVTNYVNLGGACKIHSARDDNMCLGIAGNSTENRANIQLYESTNESVQNFRIYKDGNYSCIKSVYANKWLDIALPIQIKSNVQLWESNKYDEEKWIFEDAGDGYVYIQSKTGYYLDLEGDKAENHANIQMYYFAENDSQRWRVEDISSYVDVDDGIYTVRSAYNDNMCLDISGNSTENGANIQLYEADGTDVQKFQIIKNGKYYCLKSVWADKWLDINAPFGNNSNVQLWESNDYDEEQWIFEDAGDGYVYIRSKIGYYLDLQDDSAVNRANIQIYNYCGNKSQKWRLERCDKEIEHDYISVVTAPTCTEQGYTTYTCSRCGDFYVDDYVEATGHSVVIDEAVDPTCTETGLTQGSHCSACNTVLVAQEAIPATGHIPGEWEVERPATVASEGNEILKCTVCTEILEERAIPKLSGPVPGTLYLDKKPSKISYELNEAFDPTGAVLRVKYNDGTIKSLSSSDVQIVGFDTTTGGNKKVHFSYTENGVTLNTWEFTILVDRQVTAIFIPHKPNKTHYICGEAFEREGMQIIATYSDGTKADVTAEVRTSGYDSLTFGLKKMTVSYTYKGKTVTLQFSYEMNPKLTGLILTHKPNKLGTYKVGEPLSKEGMIITAKFSDGSTKDVTHLIRTSGYSSKQVGKQIITVSYTYGTQTKSVQFSIIMSQT